MEAAFEKVDQLGADDQIARSPEEELVQALSHHGLEEVRIVKEEEGVPGEETSCAKEESFPYYPVRHLPLMVV